MTPPPDPSGDAAADAAAASIPDPQPGRAPLGRAWLALAVLALATVVGLGAWATACGSDEPEPRTIEIVVPAGTGERLAAGEKVVVMPARLEFTVGDQIRIRNEDSVEQSVGPYVVQAGEELLLRYGKEGTYEGYCPLTEGERYEIVVTAA